MGAPSFKDCVAADIHGVFLNNQEFASTHTIDGKEMDAVVDDNALLDGTRPGRRPFRRDLQGAPSAVCVQGRLRRPAAIRQAPGPGRPEYRVVQADDDAGMLAIEIEAIRT